MRSAQTLQRLEEVLKPSLQEVLPNTIIPCDGGYEAFGAYEIRPESGLWRVYRSRRDPLEFSSSRTALAWCIADKLHNIHLSMEIRRLDGEKTAISSDIAVRTRLRDRMRDPERAEAVEIKLDTRRRRLESVESSLAKCVNQAKYLQIRGFNNETARTGRPTPHRTNR